MSGSSPASGACRRPLVLASASRTRASLLRNAGVPFAVHAPAVDETRIRRSLRAEGAPDTAVAPLLADAKAVQVSRLLPGALVLGADQTLLLDGAVLAKPADRAEARAQLTALSGRSHRLHAALALACDGAVVWRHAETAQMTVRPLTPAFLDYYLETGGDSLLQSVGAYQLEGLGGQLFTRVDGDVFAVLGLPLLPLLDVLRRHGAIPT